MIMKKLILTIFLLGSAVIGFGQCSNCVTTQTYYLDIDGDGFGVNDSLTNIMCCPEEASSDSLYVRTLGDLCPFNKAISLAYASECPGTCTCDSLLQGCVHPLACNYSTTATIDDGSCKFPDATKCEECDGSGNVKIIGGRCSCESVNYKVYDAVGNCELPGGSAYCTQDLDEDGYCDHDTNGDGEIDDPCLGSTCNEKDALGVCGGRCLKDNDQDGVCDEYGTPGCYTMEIPTTPVDACTDSTACNYLDDLAVACIFKNECGYCGAINDTIPTSAYWISLGIADSTGNAVCDELDLEGCIDSTACNYNPDATWGLLSDWCLENDECGVCGGPAAYLDSTNTALGFTDGRCTCTTWREEGKNCDGSCINDTLPNDAYWTSINLTDSLGTGTGNGICDELEVIGCMRSDACNYDAHATLMGLDACIMRDSLDVCGGSCFADTDNDGICDDVDPCPNDSLNIKDECGVCGGSGFVAGACNCEGDTLDALDICGGNCQLDADDDGICDDNGNDPCFGTIDATGNCGGGCTADVDQDGICDNVDTCLIGSGVIDECNVCDGPGYPTGYCNCEGTLTYDAVLVCGGDCTADEDGDLICDDVDDCIGVEDECGVCDGPGIPDGQCDCSGNVVDILGVCGGKCTTDVDGDGICDDDLDGDGIPNDPCTEGTGIIDECGVCNGPGGLEECGCEASRSGYCDCDGNVYDACGVCGGPGKMFARDCDGLCINDSDGDGVCDEEEELGFRPRINDFIDPSTGEFVTSINPFNVQNTINTLETLKTLMHNNLEAGSLRGTSLNLTIEESIVDSGVWVNKELAQLKGDLAVRSLILNGDFITDGDLNIEGTQLSDGGLKTTSLSLTNQMVVGGDGDVSSINIDGRTNLKDSLLLRAQLDVSAGIGVDDLPNDSILFKFQPSSGKIYSEGGVKVMGDLNVPGNARFNNLEAEERSLLKEFRVADLFDVNASADVKGNFRVNSLFGATTNGLSDGLVTIGDSTVAGTGDVFVKGSFIATGNVLVKGDLTIEGVTFSDGGVEATALTLSGDLDSVGGNTSAGQFLNVFGTTTLRSDLSMGGDLHAISSVDSVFGTDTTFSVYANTGNLVSKVELSSVSLMAHDTLDVTTNLTTAELNVTGSSQLGGDFYSGGGKLVFQNQTTINGPVKSSGTVSSSANVGGIRVRDNSTFNGSLTTSGGLSNTQMLDVDGVLNVSSQHEFAGSFENENASTSQRVMAIQIDNHLPGNANRYVSFHNIQGKEMGRIQGEQVSVLATGKFQNSGNDLLNNSDYMLDQLSYRYDMMNAEQAYSAAERAYLFALLEVAQGVIETIAEATSTTACFGITFIWAVFFPIPVPFIAACVPHLDDAAKDGIEELVSAANVVLAYEAWVQSYVGITLSERDYRNWIDKGILGSMRGLDASGNSMESIAAVKNYKYENATTAHNRVGVTYQSGSGDYAEWLPKYNALDDFKSGQVAGVFQGALRFETDGAERLVVISTNPIVLGNTPESRIEDYEKAAFMGQVPVRVLGPVRSGDYLIASGLSDGNARAVSPRDLTAGMMDQVIGTAWEAGLNPFRNVVNCSVGLENGQNQMAADLGKRTKHLMEETESLKDMLSFWYSNNGKEVSASEMLEEGPLKKPIVVDEETGELTFYRPGIDDVEIKPPTKKQIEHSVDRFLEEVDRQRLLGHTAEVTEKLEEIFKNEESRRLMVQMLEIALDRYNAIAVQAMRDFEGQEVTKIRYAPANIQHRIPEEAWGEFGKANRSGEMDNKRFKKWYLRKAR